MLLTTNRSPRPRVSSALVPFGAEHLEKPELAFEHGARPLKTVGCQARSEHTRLRGPPEMQALDHAAVAAGEFEQAAGERPGDAERIGHRPRIEPKQMPGGDSGAERAGRARRVKAACLVGVAGRPPDPDHDLVAGDKGGDQFPAIAAVLLSHASAGGNTVAPGWAPAPGRVRLSSSKAWASAPLASAAAFAWTGAAIAAKDTALAAGPGALGVADDDPAPGQRAAADDRRDRVGNAVLGSLDDLGWQILIPQSGGVFSEPDGFLRHIVRPPG